MRGSLRRGVHGIAITATAFVMAVILAIVAAAPAVLGGVPSPSASIAATPKPTGTILEVPVPQPAAGNSMFGIFLVMIVIGALILVWVGRDWIRARLLGGRGAPRR